MLFGLLFDLSLSKKTSSFREFFFLAEFIRIYYVLISGTSSILNGRFRANISLNRTPKKSAVGENFFLPKSVSNSRARIE